VPLRRRTYRQAAVSYAAVGGPNQVVSASSVAPDEIFRALRLAVGQPDVDAGVILREAGHFTSARAATASAAAIGPSAAVCG
jgi:hypothetical protein